MAQKNAQGIAVSKEEERFLRQAFRRFALPYVLVFAALAWGVSTLSGSESGGASTESVEALQGEISQLRAEVAALDGRIAAIGAEAEAGAKRVAALEKRPASPARDDSDIERKVRDATQRFAQLEKRVKDQAAGERLDALAARMTAIEREMRATAAAAPRPAAPAPGPRAVPGP